MNILERSTGTSVSSYPLPSQLVSHNLFDVEVRASSGDPAA